MYIQLYIKKREKFKSHYTRLTSSRLETNSNYSPVNPERDLGSHAREKKKLFPSIQIYLCLLQREFYYIYTCTHETTRRTRFGW